MISNLIEELKYNGSVSKDKLFDIFYKNGFTHKYEMLEYLINFGLLIECIDNYYIYNDKIEDSTIIEEAYTNNNMIRKVVLPQYIKRIGRAAFANTHNLECIILNEGLEYIEEAAFKNSRPKTIVFPSSIKRIDSSAFITEGYFDYVMHKVVYDRLKKLPKNEFDCIFCGCRKLTIKD